MVNNLHSIKLRYGIIGTSMALDQALDTAIRVAPTDLTVLITGESGVGKEVFSKIIHSLSPRKHNQFIAINCGAIPEGTINSELFGHEKGSFTGASEARKGYFETVDGGTIFLDEIGEMPQDTQAYLLRVLESGEFLRVGASKVQKTNVRVIAATNMVLYDSVKKGKFREDLYFRLNTVPIHVPALKDRPEDINPLFRKFASDFAEKYHTTSIRLDEDGQEILRNYRWRGNIRELKNLAEQVSVLSENKNITANDLKKFIPNIEHRNLPINIENVGKSDNFQEREILYKLLFDMKKDLNDLKSLVFELIKNNDLQVPDAQYFKGLQAPADYPSNERHAENYTTRNFHSDGMDYFSEEPKKTKPVIMEKQESTQIPEFVEDNLSIVEMEKTMILKALKKHVGKRKEAADDLGISERTLYRKIKEYEL